MSKQKLGQTAIEHPPNIYVAKQSLYEIKIKPGQTPWSPLNHFERQCSQTVPGVNLEHYHLTDRYGFIVAVTFSIGEHVIFNVEEYLTKQQQHVNSYENHLKYVLTNEFRIVVTVKISYLFRAKILHMKWKLIERDY